MQKQVTRESWLLNRSPQDRARATWRGGRFETARRGPTAEVEGRIEPDFHLVMVTLNGGAGYHEFRTDEGFRYAGIDARRTVSFLPAGCNRELVLRDVAWEWGAIAIDPAVCGAQLARIKPFVADCDDFIYMMTAQMGGLFRRDGQLDACYSSTMALALCEYIANRAEGGAVAERKSSYKLTQRQVRETYGRIDAWLGQPITIADLAVPLGISEGHFFRAFRGATGLTPLQAISGRRMDEAARLLRDTDLDVIEISARCGIESPSHFARLFRSRKGFSPSQWRRL